MARSPSSIPGLILLGIAFVSPARAGDLPPASRWIPADATAAVEVTRPQLLLDALLDPALARAVHSLPAYRRQASTMGFLQLLGVIAHLEARLETDWKTGLRHLLGGGLTLAAFRDGSTLLAVDSEDTALLQGLENVVLEFARAGAANEGHPERVSSRDYRGVVGWTLGPGEAHAIVDRRLLLANRASRLEAALDLRAGLAEKSLAALPAYRAARRAAGAEAVASVFVNLEVLGKEPALRQALDRNLDPLVSLLLAGAPEVLRESKWLVLALHLEGGRLVVRALPGGRQAGSGSPVGFASPRQSATGMLPNLLVPRQIAALSFYRDLHGFYAAKDDLFAERTSGLIFFENMMGIFFSGLDLTDEVLAETRPEIRLVIASQEYDPSVGTPRVKVPAFAAVLGLRNPETFGEVVEEAWQKAIGLVNFTRGQQALPGLIIDRVVHGGTKFSVAHFRPPGVADRSNIALRYNLRPALAQKGEYLILSSTEELARDLIDALEQDVLLRPGAARRAHSLVELNGGQLRSILELNRENLVRQNMVQKGNTPEQAGNEIELLLSVLGFLKHARLAVGDDTAGPWASLELELERVGPERVDAPHGADRDAPSESLEPVVREDGHAE